MAALGESNSDTGFFSLLPAPPALLGGLELLAEAAVIARELPGPEAAAIIELAASVREGVTLAGVETAKAADSAIEHRIDITRKRPEAGAWRGGRKRLNEGIHSEALGNGAVGIGSIDDLDKVVGTDGRPYWRAQEEGTSANVGREIFGTFEGPGLTPGPPNQAEFRVHPVFTPGDGLAAGKGTIRRPIPARHFLRDGAAIALLFREDQFRGIELSAIDVMRGLRAALV